MSNFYFVFGTWEGYPYGEKDYVLVVAENLEQAVHLYQAVHPNKEGSKIVLCADWYDENEWVERIRDEYYKGVEPIETIVVSRREN